MITRGWVKFGYKSPWGKRKELHLYSVVLLSFLTTFSHFYKQQLHTQGWIRGSFGVNLQVLRHADQRESSHSPPVQWMNHSNISATSELHQLRFNFKAERLELLVWLSLLQDHNGTLITDSLPIKILTGMQCSWRLSRKAIQIYWRPPKSNLWFLYIFCPYKEIIVILFLVLHPFASCLSFVLRSFVC